MNNDSLDQLLGITPDESANTSIATVEGELVEATPETSTTTLVVADSQPTPIKELESDFQHGRKVIKDALDAVRPALDSAILLAQSGDSPRAYEVVGKLLENIVAASRELTEIHKSKKDVLEPTAGPATSLLPQGDGGTVNIDKAVFVGRASDLLREIRQLAKQSDTSAKES